MSDSINSALIGFVWQLLPEVILGIVACVLYLGSTFRPGRNVWGAVALVGLVLASVAMGYVVSAVPTLEDQQAALRDLDEKENAEKDVAAREKIAKEKVETANKINAIAFSAPLQLTRLAIFFKILALAAGFVLILVGWNDPDDEHAGEYHGCLLLIIAGASMVGSANELITLFLALELVSIPTYVLLYLARTNPPAQEAAMKYFLLSIFSSGLLLFGFSYLYGVTGTTNISAILEALAVARSNLTGTAEARGAAGWQGMTLIALVMVVAGLGFKITAVPFHFYAPDVYQGTTTPAAAILAFIPKVIGFAALVRLLGLVPSVVGLTDGLSASSAMGEQVPVLLWIMAAVTMSLGNVLALLQDNIRRMLAYSSVAHAGYMLIGLAVAPRLESGAASDAVGGVEAMLFYLVAYGAMTVGAFAVLYYLETPQKRVENVDDLAGLSRTHPGLSLLMVVFMFSLIGMPLTAGFTGKLMLFWDAMGLNAVAGQAESKQLIEQARLYRVLALIGAVNAAIGGWYYLRVIAVMYLREPVEPLPRQRPWPALACIWVCAALTLGLGIYAPPLVNAIKAAVPRRNAEARGMVLAPERPHHE